MKKRITRSIVPNLLTLGNLFSGFIAIVSISKGEFFQATMLIIMAAIFDMVDGIAARLFKSTSEFGVELDSLCDAVSFGVAPAYMLYKAFFWEIGEIGLLLSALPALAGVVRLARFNVKLTSFEDKKYFTGLPIPSSALTIISYLMFYHIPGKIIEPFTTPAIIAVTVLTSFAMVSTIKYDNLPRPTPKSFRQKPVFSILTLAALIAAIVTKGHMIFPIMALFILFGMIRAFIVWLKERTEPEDELDESEDNEPLPFE